MKDSETSHLTKGVIAMTDMMTFNGSNLSSLQTQNLVAVKQNRQYTDETAVAISERAKDLRNKCRILSKSDYSSGASTNIMTKLAKFIDSYNELKKSAKDYPDKDLKKQLDNMSKLIEKNKDALKKAGIDIEDNGELKINSDTLKKLKTSSKFKSIFTGSNSFITQIQKHADKIYSKLKNMTVSKTVTFYQSKDNSSNSIDVTV